MVMFLPPIPYGTELGGRPQRPQPKNLQPGLGQW